MLHLWFTDPAIFLRETAFEMHFTDSKPPFFKVFPFDGKIITSVLGRFGINLGILFPVSSPSRWWSWWRLKVKVQMAVDRWRFVKNIGKSAPYIQEVFGLNLLLALVWWHFFTFWICRWFNQSFRPFKVHK